MILASIDVLLLDKARFKEVIRKNGKKAIFAELILIETPNGAHGDYMIKQGVTKEEREARIQMPILGNGKNAGGGSRRTDSAPATPNSDPAAPQHPDDVPF